MGLVPHDNVKIAAAQGLDLDLCRNRHHALRVTANIIPGYGNRLVDGVEIVPDMIAAGAVSAGAGRHGGCAGIKVCRKEIDRQSVEIDPAINMDFEVASLVSCKLPIGRSEIRRERDVAGAKIKTPEVGFTKPCRTAQTIDQCIRQGAEVTRQINRIGADINAFVPSVDRVVAAFAIKAIITQTALDKVIGSATHDKVRTAERFDGVRPETAIDIVRVPRSGDGLGIANELIAKVYIGRRERVYVHILQPHDGLITTKFDQRVGTVLHRLQRSGLERVAFARPIPLLIEPCDAQDVLRNVKVCNDIINVRRARPVEIIDISPGATGHLIDLVIGEIAAVT